MQPMRDKEEPSIPLQLVSDRTKTSVTWKCTEGARRLQKTEKPLNIFAKMYVSYYPKHHHQGGTGLALSGNFVGRFHKHGSNHNLNFGKCLTKST